ncbi:IclR family transcriptional regulator [Streptomyces sp. NBC_00690]|uniref:IclR family transcriptional regulator n=1 Tax=Streptomyces sp. NBC_00690 TaxID=2975808 RepID=UPI002E2C9F2F|nr:IclR family transcriptional regulator [Streptomyces sp. NBC_00690]
MTEVDGKPATARNNSASLRRALTILLHLGEDGRGRGATLTELTSGLSMNKSTVLRLLAPLCEVRLIEQDMRTGRYRLGSRTAQLGHVYLDGLDLRDTAHDVLERLVSDTGETSYLVIPDLPDIVYVDKIESPQAVRMHSPVGSRRPAYCTGVGKALLAHTDVEAVDAALAHGMPRRTPHTLATPDALHTDLAVIRSRGYAVDDMENEPDVRCVAAPVFDHAGAAVCAVSVSGPATRITSDRVPALGSLVSAAAAEISQRLGAAR